MASVSFVSLLATVNILTLFLTNTEVLGATPGGRNKYIEQQLNCALDQGPCDYFGLEIKGYLPDVIGHNCIKCTPHQVAMVRKIIRHIQSRYPDAWQQLLIKYGKSTKKNNSASKV